MKKVIIVLMSVVLVVSSIFFIIRCSGDRSAELKIYIWGEYIDDATLEGFKDWYENETGKSITVTKQEFDTNETLYTKIKAKKDFDVICPSDYMFERMKNEKLLVKLDTQTQETVSAAILGEQDDDGNYENQALYDIVKEIDKDLEYNLPYMWGTMGIMYYAQGDLNDKENIDDQDALKSTWTSLFDETNSGKIYMKDSERDSYTVALLNKYSATLSEYSTEFTNYSSIEYQTLLESFFVKGTNQEFDDKLDEAKTVLINQKPLVKAYEVDYGKDDLLKDGESKGYFGMFWSCDAGYIMAEYDNNGEVSYNENFRYIIPKEGSNVWADCFCIPKYAGNSAAANLFIQYMCLPEVAFECMDYVGCTTAVTQGANDYFSYLTENDPETGAAPALAGCSDSFQAMYLSMMFPYQDIKINDYEIESPLNRCKVMVDLGERANDKLSLMWDEFKRT